MNGVNSLASSISPSYETSGKSEKLANCQHSNDSDFKQLYPYFHQGQNAIAVSNSSNSNHSGNSSSFTTAIANNFIISISSEERNELLERLKTLLCLDCIEDLVKQAKQFLKEGPEKSPETAMSYLATAYEISTACKQEEKEKDIDALLIKTLDKCKGGVGENFLHYFIRKGSTSVCSYLLKKNPLLLSQMSHDKQLPVHTLALCGNKAMIDWFLPRIDCLQLFNQNGDKKAPYDIASKNIKEIFHSSKIFSRSFVKKEVTDFYINYIRILRRSNGKSLKPVHLLDLKLSIIKHKQAAGSETAYTNIETVEQLFEAYKQKESLSLLLLGKPGMGKSTLCNRLALLWAKESVWQKRFDLLFKINCKSLDEKECNDETRLENIIARQCLKKMGPSHKLFTAQTMKLLETVFEYPIFFLLDGYHELRADSRYTPIIQMLFPNKTKRKRNIYIFSTSRPHSNIEATQYDVCVECKGFNKKSIETYIQNTCETSESSEILAYLKGHPDIYRLVHIPIILDILCDQWRHLTKDKSESFRYPTQTIICTGIVDKLLAMRESNDSNSIVVKKLENSLKILAMRSLQKPSLQKRDIDKILFNSNNKQVQSLGYEFLMGFIGYNFENECYFFYDEILQILLAAQHLKKKLIKNKDLFKGLTVEKFFLKNKYHPTYKNVWPFLVGLLAKEKKTNLIQTIFGWILEEPRDLTELWQINLLILCLEESQIEVNSESLNYPITHLIDYFSKINFKEGNELFLTKIIYTLNFCKNVKDFLNKKFPSLLNGISETLCLNPNFNTKFEEKQASIETSFLNLPSPSGAEIFLDGLIKNNSALFLETEILSGSEKRDYLCFFIDKELKRISFSNEQLENIRHLLSNAIEKRKSK